MPHRDPTPDELAAAIKAGRQWGLDPTDFMPLPAGGRSRFFVSLSGLEKLREREEDPEVRARMDAEIERRKAGFQEKLDALRVAPRPPAFPWRMALCFLLLLATGFVAGWRLHEGKTTYDARASFAAGLKVGAICAHHPEELACKPESLKTGGVM